MPAPKTISFIVCDDYESIRTLANQSLRSLGFTGQIIECESGNKGIEALKGNKIQFIISDMIMDDGSGLDFLNNVRSGAHKETPFIMLTSEKDKETVMKVVAAGASAYVLKPWENDDLLKKIDQCWDKHNK